MDSKSITSGNEYQTTCTQDWIASQTKQVTAPGPQTSVVRKKPQVTCVSIGGMDVAELANPEFLHNVVALTSSGVVC